MISTILFILFLFLAIWMTSINVLCAKKVTLPAVNLFYMAVGWAYVAVYFLVKYGIISFSR